MYRTSSLCPVWGTECFQLHQPAMWKAKGRQDDMQMQSWRLSFTRDLLIYVLSEGKCFQLHQLVYRNRRGRHNYNTGFNLYCQDWSWTMDPLFHRHTHSTLWATPVSLLPGVVRLRSMTSVHFHYSKIKPFSTGSEDMLSVCQQCGTWIDVCRLNLHIIRMVLSMCEQFEVGRMICIIKM